MDTAWLWPVERTQYKCIHTFSTVTQYMEAYPEYKFLCSQPAQYEWIKSLTPKLYARIQERCRTLPARRFPRSRQTAGYLSAFADAVRPSR